MFSPRTHETRANLKSVRSMSLYLFPLYYMCDCIYPFYLSIYLAFGIVKNIAFVLLCNCLFYSNRLRTVNITNFRSQNPQALFSAL